MCFLISSKGGRSSSRAHTHTHSSRCDRTNVVPTWWHRVSGGLGLPRLALFITISLTSSQFAHHLLRLCLRITQPSHPHPEMSESRHPGFSRSKEQVQLYLRSGSLFQPSYLGNLTQIHPVRENVIFHIDLQQMMIVKVQTCS